MFKSVPVRKRLRLWLLMVGLLIALWLFPLSNMLTRLGGVTLVLLIWAGLAALVWHRRVLRAALIGLTLLGVGFLVWPARDLPPADLLRQDYLVGLSRYEGVKYYWGGESPVGIDCSGLIRRGLIDSLFLRGLRTFDAGLVRRSLALWWHDCSARDLGDQHQGLTIHVLDTPGLNQLDHSQILAGDLAVTRNGVHVMAYLGASRWIEADPTAHRVIIVPVPADDNAWFSTPMTIIRWKIFTH